MRHVARNRAVGTAIGAVWGMLVLLLELKIISDGMPDELIHYLLLGVFTGVVIYFTVLLKVTEASYFSAVVFLSIAVNHIGDANPYLFVANRVLDTVIGILIALVVNCVHLPRRRERDTLFVSGISDTILGADRQLHPYSKVELNRLIEDGAKFTISTIQTPATVRELLAGVDLRYPIIAMDGAVLYDLKRLAYVKTIPLSEAQAERMARFLDGEGIPYFINTVEHDLLVIRYRELANQAMRELYEGKRKSPYRNYSQIREGDFRDVVYFLILEESEKLERVCQRLRQEEWARDYRVTPDPSMAHGGFSVVRIYSAAASREAMLRELERRMQTKETVTFGSIAGRYDVYIEHADKDAMVKELKRRFEPVDLRCWRNIFRF